MKLETYLELCSSGMHPEEAQELTVSELRFVSDSLPPCIYAQLDCRAARFLKQWLAEVEAQELEREGNLLEVLDR